MHSRSTWRGYTYDRPKSNVYENYLRKQPWLWKSEDASPMFRCPYPDLAPFAKCLLTLEGVIYPDTDTSMRAQSLLKDELAELFDPQMGTRGF